MKKIPLNELLSAYNLCVNLREDYQKRKNPYTYISAIYTDEQFSERLLIKQIERHGYKHLNGKFYNKKDLKKIKHNSVRDGDDHYDADKLSELIPL